MSGPTVEQIRGAFGTWIEGAKTYSAKRKELCEAFHAGSCYGSDYCAAEIERLRGELDQVRTVCSEVYQVVGAIGLGGAKYKISDIDRVLDNLHAASGEEPIPHDDLLPWPADD